MMTAVEIARMSNKEHCATAIERFHEELERDPELKRIAAKNYRGRPPEKRDTATQTEDCPPVTTTTVEQSVQCSSDDDVTETPEAIQPPGVDASTSTDDDIRPRKETASRHRQRRPMTRGELIQAQVKAYEAVRAACGGLQAARLEQIRSAYGVRSEPGSERRGSGLHIECTCPPRIAAIGREQTMAGCPERTYDRAISCKSGRNALSTDFRIHSGTCRHLGELPATMQGSVSDH
jgi:hypothetical protein